MNQDTRFKVLCPDSSEIQSCEFRNRDTGFIRTDVSIEADVKAVIEHAVVQFGLLDCLFNKAGIRSQRAELANYPDQRKV